MLNLSPSLLHSPLILLHFFFFLLSSSFVVTGKQTNKHRKTTMATDRNFVMVIRNTTLVCHSPHSMLPRGVWNFGNALHTPTPLLLLQFSAISFVARLLELCLKPLGQSTIVAQIFVRFSFLLTMSKIYIIIYFNIYVPILTRSI